MALKLGLVGIGKIARDQHIPALAADPHFDLVACASRHARVEGVANFADIETLLAEVPHLDAISICTPPQAHFEAALAALRAGKHVMLEKPPAATTRQIALLQSEAARHGRTIFQTWHSRFAGGVDASRDWLRGRTLTGGTITWKEDVHHWHPGQQWIWEPGGLGVFDPGINALSVLTEVLSEEAFVHTSVLEFPENQQAPIAARLALRTEAPRHGERGIRLPPEGRADLGHRTCHNLRPPQALSRRWRAGDRRPSAGGRRGAGG